MLHYLLMHLVLGRGRFSLLWRLSSPGIRNRGNAILKLGKLSDKPYVLKPVVTVAGLWPMATSARKAQHRPRSLSTVRYLLKTLLLPFQFSPRTRLWGLQMALHSRFSSWKCVGQQCKIVLNNVASVAWNLWQSNLVTKLLCSSLMTSKFQRSHKRNNF